MDKQNLIEELKALEAQATPGPWYVGESRGAWPVWTIEHGLVGETCGEHDAKLISTMRNALPDLLAHVAQLEAERDAAVEAAGPCVVKTLCSQCPEVQINCPQWRNPARKG